MRFPAACYQMLETVDTHFADCLVPRQRRGLVVWVYGVIAARSACQNAVVAALVPVCRGRAGTIRQYLREWLYDGKDKAAPCETEITISLCFAPLLRWVLTLWRGDHLVRAIDVTNLRDRLHALSIAVLYRGCAIPVAWHLRRGGEKGEWTPEFVRLLELLAPAVPPELEVLVLMDAGLRSPTIWQTVTRHGWHVIQRHDPALWFRPAGWHAFHHATDFVLLPGHAWVGSGHAFKQRETHRPATLIVVWEQGAPGPWVLLTDLAPRAVGVTWYGLRMWIELGFRLLKSLGWHWQRTRRTDTARMERHWLVLAVATCWVLATGTRVEDTTGCRTRLPHLQTPPITLDAASMLPPPRVFSVFSLGWTRLVNQCRRGRIWRTLWLTPDPLPPSPPHLSVWRDSGPPHAPV